MNSFSHHLSLLDDDIPELSSLLNLEVHVPLPHVEQLLSLLQMVVLALVGAADVKNLRRNCI